MLTSRKTTRGPVELQTRQILQVDCEKMLSSRKHMHQIPINLEDSSQLIRNRDARALSIAYRILANEIRYKARRNYDYHASSSSKECGQ